MTAVLEIDYIKVRKDFREQSVNRTYKTDSHPFFEYRYSITHGSHVHSAPLQSVYVYTPL